MQTLDSKQKVEIVSAILHELPLVTAIYLFGSMADNSGLKDSDVDLAILQDSPILPETAFRLRGRIGQLVKRDVDILDCRRCRLEMAYNVVMSGVVLFVSNPDAVALYENTLMSMYVNFSIERRELMKDIEKTGTIYGR